MRLALPKRLGGVTDNCNNDDIIGKVVSCVRIRKMYDSRDTEVYLITDFYNGLKFTAFCG